MPKSLVIALVALFSSTVCAQSPVTPETSDHALILTADKAKTSGKSVRVNPSHGALAWWKTTADRAAWTIRGAKNGSYAVVLDYAVADGVAGQEFIIEAGDEKLQTKAATTGGWGKWKLARVGKIEISESDPTLSFGPAKAVKGNDLLDLRAIQLIPINSPRLNDLKSVTAAPREVLPAERKKIKGNQPATANATDDGVFTLIGKDAEIFGEPMTLVASSDKNHPDAAIDGWMQKADRAEWQLRGIKAGRYDVLVDWAMPRIPSALQKAAIRVDGVPVFTGPIRTTEGIDKFASYVIGTIDLPAGDHRFSFGPGGEVKERWVRLRSIRLVPAAGEGEWIQPPMTVPEGFTIEPAAIPPLVAHPMMACLDDRGRMFIAESSGTNAQAPELLETRPHKILMLEDEDGDGVFDKSTVFADNLVLPNGAQWHDGALYVCSPPYIWKFEDRDDDGRAEIQTPVGGKFGFNGMSSAFHGPVLGPDGRIYWCGGQHGWRLGDTSPGLEFDKEEWTSRGPGVFSMWPDGSDPENLAQGGLANPVEVTFSSEGEVFGTVAVYEHLNGRTDALLHWLHGSVYNLKRRGPPVHPATSRTTLAPMSRRGWVAPPGLTRYRTGGNAAGRGHEAETGFGAEYRDDIFMCEFNTHRVYRIMPERQGASYVTTDEIFLESTSPYTHFTDVMEDADGSLLVVDTGGWFLYGCPTSAISRPEIKGGIYRIRKDDAHPIKDPRGLEFDWDNPRVDWLDDARFAVRDRAKTELAKQGEKVIPVLEKILTNSTTTEGHCREAIWTLTRIDHPKARDVVREAIFDRSPSVRQTAIRSCSVWRDRDAASYVEAIVGYGDEPEVIREAATAMGRIGTVGSPIETLFAAVRKNAGHDPYLDHSLIYALIELGNWNHKHSFLEHPDPNVQRAALIACVEMEKSESTAEHVAPFLSASDPDLRAEALRLVTARPDWGGSLVGFLKRSLKANKPAGGIDAALLAFVGNVDVQKLLADSLITSPEARDIALKVMQASQLKSVPVPWTSALIDALSKTPDKTIIDSIGHLGIPSADSALLKLATDTEKSIPVRLAALDVAADRLPSPFAPSLFEFSAACLQTNQPTQLRIDSARILARAPLSDEQRIQCASQLVSEAGPLQIGPLLGVFEGKKLNDKTRTALAAALETSPGLFSVPSDRISGIFGKDTNTATPLLEKIRAAESQREQRLDELVASTSEYKGDAEHGKAAFTKATCSVCHKAKGEGGAIGPELTTIGSIRSERDLLEAIAFPSATFAREYEPFVVTLNDGTVKMGRIGNDGEDALELIDAQGIATRISASQIASREMAPVSMMPPGLERVLTSAELADLVAYLRSLK